LAAIFSGHPDQSFVVDALLVAAKAAPIDLVLKDRMKKSIDGESFTGAGVAGN
jgi:hypothetical protein